MADLLTLDISKRFESFELRVKEHIALEGITALFGPSGSGKSTLLRLIAGFERPDQGHIHFNDTVWTEGKIRLNPQKRGVGYVVQNGALFSHLTVQGNLDYAVDRRRKDSGSFELKSEEVIDALGLSALLGRATTSLSGGERQRVALARSILNQPKFLLLDEPLAALDRKSKSGILPFLRRLPTEFHMPCLYISHDIAEVSQIADHMILIQDGTFRTQGQALHILGQIEDVAGEPAQSGAVFDAVFKAYDPELGLSTLSLGDATIIIPARLFADIGAQKRIRIAAKDVAIARSRPEGLSIRNCLPVTLTALHFPKETPFAELTLALDPRGSELPPLRARITRAAALEMKLQVGHSVFALVKSVSFDKTLL